MASSVYVTRNLPEDILAKLEQNNVKFTQWASDDPVPHDTLVKEIKGKDGLLCLLTDKIDTEVLDSAGPQLKVVSTMSVGYDHIDLPALKERHIRLGHTGAASTEAIAEMTVALLLATTRRIPEAIESVKDGSWGTWKPFWLCGRGLTGSTVGIVGMGRIGHSVAKRIGSFGVQRLVFADKPVPSFELAGGVKVESVGIEELLKESDFVISCCLLTDETKDMFNDKTFAAMKNHAIFVNVGRGGLVDHEALHRALVSGQIAGAGLDVTVPEPLPTDSPLLKLKNCIVLPHVASNEIQTMRAMARVAVDNLIAGLKGPDAQMPTEVRL